LLNIKIRFIIIQENIFIFVQILNQA